VPAEERSRIRPRSALDLVHAEGETDGQADDMLRTVTKANQGFQTIHTARWVIVGAR